MTKRSLPTKHQYLRPQIFVNYRGPRGKAKGAEFREALATYFGNDQIFFAEKSLLLAKDYRQGLREGVQGCAVLLILVGPDWLEGRRIDDPDDWVRQEIEIALGLPEQIMPVVVYYDGAKSLKVEDLPESIRELVHLHRVGRESDALSNIRPELIDKLLKVNALVAVGAPQGLSWLGHEVKLSIPQGLYLSGSARPAEQLREFLAGAPGVLQIRADPHDAIAFISEVWLQTPPKMAVHVTNLVEADLCAKIDVPMIVVVSADVAPVPVYLEHGQHVILIGRDGRHRGDTIDLPPMSLPEAQKVFEREGSPWRRARKLARIARASQAALLTELGERPPLPAWVGEPLAPGLMLVGGWPSDPSDADKAAITAVAGCDWSEVESFVARYSTGPDPLFRRSAKRWQVAVPRRAWSLLRDHVTRVLLDRWTGLVTGHVPCSVELRERTTAMLVQLGMDERRLDRGGTGKEIAGSLVKTALDECSLDPTGDRWRSVARLLGLLAEASPDGFLLAVDSALQGKNSLLASLYAEPPNPLAPSVRTRLLFALETICWAPEHLPHATRTLTKLAGIPLPGDEETAMVVLRRAHEPRFPCTTAPLEDRMDVLGGVQEDYPDIWWSLVLPLLRQAPPAEHAITVEPWFRPWLPDDAWSNVQDPDPWYDAVVKEVLAQVAGDPRRWNGITDVLDEVPQPYFGRLVDALTDVEVTGSQDDWVVDLWVRLTSMERHYRTYEFLPVEALDRLKAVAARIEPAGRLARHYRLFRGYAVAEGTEELRVAAMTEVAAAVAGSGVDGLLDLVRRCDHTGLLGESLAKTTGSELFGHVALLLGTEGKVGEFAEAYVRELAQRGNDIGSVEQFATWSEHAQARFMVAVGSSRDLTEHLQVADGHAVDVFWQHVGRAPLAGWTPENYYAELVRRGRPWTVIKAFADHFLPVWQPSWRPSEDLIREVLTSALTASSVEPAVGMEEPLRVLFHHLGAQPGCLKVTALLEWRYWQNNQRIRPHSLYRWISSDPDGFVELLQTASPGRLQVVLHSLRTPPDDPEAWLARARELTTDDPEVRRYVEHFAGRMLAGAAADADGRWPAAGVARLLETAESDDLLEGYAMGLAPGWGSTRGLYSGGEQEREMIAKLRVYADGVRNRRPRVSKAIEGAMGFFETVARHHDDSAEGTQDEY